MTVSRTTKAYAGGRSRPAGGTCLLRRRGPARQAGPTARVGRTYFGVSACAASAACFLRWSQLYFFWNFSTRPVVSMNFILPVKNGWHTEQISTVMFFLVLRVVNLLPQPQVTVASTYSG